MIGPEIPEQVVRASRSTTPDGGPSARPSIGPDIPKQLLDRPTTPDEEYGPSIPAGPSIGPQVPPEILARSSTSVTSTKDEEDEEDDYAPALPPDLLAARSGPPKPSATPSSSAPKPVKGPTLPPSLANWYDEEESDDEVGPMPLPEGVVLEEKDGVQEFLEKEERRRKQIEEAAKPKALKREEWMLVPPSSSDLLASIDPTKLTKGRQFSRTSAPIKKADNSLWTETPAERQQRIADEVAGKRRRAVNADPDADEEALAEARKKRKRDEEIRKEVDEYTRKKRGGALLEQHATKVGTEKKDEESPVIWDHSRDMALGGRLMGDKERDKLVKEARGLSDRFGTGRSGGFL